MERKDPRYPLSWPFGWKRTPEDERKASDFRETADVMRAVWTDGIRHDKSVRGTKPVSLRTACDRLQEQLDRLGATDTVLSTNVELTLAGEPRGGMRPPKDPGAAAYFKLQQKDRVLACDRWRTVQENVAALAAHIDAIRRVDRYGVGTMDQAFAGYDALPAPSEDNRPPWRKILGFKPMTEVTPDDVNVNFKALAKLAVHNHSRMVELNLARDQALRELSG
jgi:hypothetical protein